MKPELTYVYETSPTAFQFLYMTLAMDIIDGCGLSNEVCHVLLPKKCKVRKAVLTIHFQ